MLSARATLLATVIAVLAIVGLTCWPVVAYPQLEPDDFRYLSLVHGLEHGVGPGLIDSCVVENRWDAMWFVETDAVVRFFRPTVLASYWLDTKIWSDVVTGLLWTNVLLHAACCLLVAAVLWRAIANKIAVLFASALFTAFYCHGECIWYVSGRTDTLAALGFLSALALHVWGGETRPWMRRLAPVAWAFAIVSKELTAALPVVLLAWDRWIEGRAPSFRALLLRDRWLYVAYAVIGIAFFAVRFAVLGSAGGSDLVYPYFVDPSSELFLPHLWVQLRSYAGNLVYTEATNPFERPEHLALLSTWQGSVLSLAAIAGFAFLLVRDARTRVLALLAVLTWLPTCFVYVSERYLYLPSVAVAGATAIGLERLRARRGVFLAALVVAAVWISHQAYWLYLKNWGLCAGIRETLAMQQRLTLPERPLPGRTMILVDFPGDMIHAQFTPAHLRWWYQDPNLRVHIVNLAPRGPGTTPTTVKRIDPHTLELRNTPTLMDEPRFFDYVDYSPRTIERETLGYTVRLLDGDKQHCRRVRLRFERPLDESFLVQFHYAPGTENLRPGDRILQGKFEILRP